MWGGRAPWLVLATLMSAAAVAVGAGMHLRWLPCRDELLNGSIVTGYRLTADFSTACLARMEAVGPFPLSSGEAVAEPGVQFLVALAMLALALGWALFMAAQRWPALIRTVAALPGVLTGVLGLSALAQSRGMEIGAGVLQWLTLGIDLTALLAAGVIVQRSQGLSRVGQLVGLWGIASFGWMRSLLDYALMLGASAANWDLPPGTGFATALTIGVCGVVAGGLGLLDRAVVRRSHTRLPTVATPHAL